MTSNNDNIIGIKVCPVCESVRRAVRAMDMAFAAETDADEVAALERAQRYLDLANCIADHTGHGPVNIAELSKLH
jgi:hypothetical protein